MPTLQNPLTLAQIRQQTVDLLGSLFAEQSFMPSQIDEAVNWACEELARTLGMSYVPQTRCYLQAGDPRRPGVPDACIKVVSANLTPEVGATVTVPNCGITTPILATLDTSIYGDICDVVASDGVASIFMARHNGVFQSGNPKGWVIVKSDADGLAPEIVAGILGPNDTYADPPTSDPEYTTPVDGIPGVSTVMDVMSMAVSPDGNTVAWFEGTTNILRVAELIAGVWTTRTVAGAYNAYRVDGTGPAAGFSAGLAPGDDTHYPAYGRRFANGTGFGIAFLDNTHLLMTETPLEPGAYAAPGSNVPTPSRLLEIDLVSGTVSTLATEMLPVVTSDNNILSVNPFMGGWLFPKLLPAGQTINGCGLVINRLYAGMIQDTSNLHSDELPIGDQWPHYTALQGMQGDIAPGSPIVDLAVTGRTQSGPGARPFEAFQGALGLDVSPLGLIVCVPAQIVNQTVTDANGSTVFFPDPGDLGSFPFKGISVGPNAGCFPDHMVSFYNGAWVPYPLAGGIYLHSHAFSCWLMGQLIVNVVGQLVSCGGA